MARLIWLVFALAACGQPPGATAPVPARTEILWDTFGVPHIYGRTSPELFRAVGWAQMDAHGDLLLRLYAQARGRAAEYLGESMLESDRLVHTMGVPDLARTWWTAQTPESRALLEAYVAGINEWAVRHRDRVPAALAGVLPAEPTDVLGHTLRSVHFTFMPPSGEIVGAAQEPAGSNGWAIGPARSASGHAMLVANPHLPWADLFTWFEMHLVAPGVDAYGVSFVGLPTLAIGWNRNLGWTHTVNTIDAADYYELSLVPGGYRLDDKVRAFEKQSKTLKIRTEAGHRVEQIEILRSVHGPVVAMTQGKAIALRVAGLDRPHLIDQYWRMTRATNLVEFETALRTQQLPMFTVLYADRDGHIMHLFNGAVPVRSGGTFEDNAGIRPGDRSSAIWTRTHGYDDLPRVVDPATGWLQNANDPPWTTTFPSAIDPARYPSYIAPRGMHLRAQRSARMIMEDRDKLTFDELVSYKHSTRMELADRLLDDVLPIARARGTERTKRAAEVLARWDRNADADSRGAVLFQQLDSSLRKHGKTYWKLPWDPARPLATPDGVTDPDAVLAAFDDAAKLIEDRHGALDVAWGDVYRLRIGSLDLPANGATGDLGVFRVVGYMPAPDHKTQTAWFGDSFVAVVELGPQVRARVLLTYGNSSREDSPHRVDQLELFSRKQLRDAWLIRSEIEAHLERREQF